MLVWRLWRALRNPPAHDALFQRAFASPEEPPPWYIGCVQWLAIPLVLPLIALAGSVYGLGWAVGVSNRIGKEREAKTLDLLSLCSSGALGAGWAIATGYLYRHRTFRNINAPENLFTRVLLMAFFLAGLELFTDFMSAYPPQDRFGGLVERASLGIITLACALYVDHIASLATSALVGIAAPGYATDRLNAQFFAFAMYAGLQLAVYLVTLTAGFVVLPAMYDGVGLRGEIAYASLILLRFAIFLALRYGCVALLWRALLQQLNAAPAELDALLRGTL